MNWRIAAACLAVAWDAVTASAATGPLHIYIEDSHAGSFYWLAGQTNLERPCTLIHFDAHSDASGIFDSDRIRDALRHVSSREERQDLLEKWRTQGAIQCFSWIEPLVPAPIAKVIWVPAGKLSETEKQKREAKAIAQLDGHLEAAPRQSGSFRQRYVVSDFENLRATFKSDQPLIVTLDLDYFTGLDASVQVAEFNRLWDFVLEQPNLRAVTFAISRPYLRDEDEADRLLELALKAAFSIPSAQIEFEPFGDVGRDHSARAKEFEVAGQIVPTYQVATASDSLRARILAERERIIVNHERARWEKLLDTWRNDAPQLHLSVKGAQRSTDGVWRIPVAEEAKIELVAEPWLAEPRQIEWFALTPRYSCCNVTALRVDQVGFVANAAPRPVWNEVSVPGGESILPLANIEEFFDRKSHTGSVRLRARAVVDGKTRVTPVMELRRCESSGFRAALSEQFGLPYLFGSGSLSDGTNTGPETNLGADCANFVVYALRRQGLRVPWSDPKQLRQFLAPRATALKCGSAQINEDEIARGLIVHLGAHVAAVMDDRPPLGVLDENDLVAHQLKRFPETLTLGELLQERKQDSFDLFSVPVPEPAGATLVFGGDVMLGRSCAEKIWQGVDPFAGIRERLAQCTFAAANLECTISDQAIPQKTRYAFRAPGKSAALLRAAGFQAVALANNHAMDFGADALHECAQNLMREKITPLGVITMWEGPQRRDPNSAYTPQIFPLPNGRHLAVLAISDLGVGRNSAACPPRREPTNSPVIATASNRARLQTALDQARAQANLVACMVHWGVENTTIVTDRQRELARWLIDHGADIVAGSHPHCVQPLDYYHGRPIAYSLGNLVFDGAPSAPLWNRGALLEIRLSRDARVIESTLVPIVLKEGLPVLSSKSEFRISKQ